MKKKKSRHHITFLDATDLEVAVRGALGQSTKAIQMKTRLTPCQITYRLAKAGIKRIDYRNGETQLSRQVYNEMGERIGDRLQATLSRQFT